MSEMVTPPARADSPPETKLWFGVLAAPIAWAVNELAGVAVVGRSCGSGGALAGWQWIALIGLAVAALLVSAWGGLTALGVFRGWSGGESPASSDGLGRVEFMALAGVLVSAFLLLNILFFGLMPFIVDPCLRTT